MFYKEPDKIERPPAEWNYSKLTPENLVLAYKQAYQKMERKLPPPKHSFEGIVGHEKVSVRSRVRSIWDKLIKRTRVFFKELLDVYKRQTKKVVLIFLSTRILLIISLSLLSHAASNDMETVSYTHLNR